MSEMTDYISREWLLAEYDRRHKGPPGGMQQLIKEAPTADVRPVVRGEWEVSMWFITCSVCGYTSADTDDEGDRIATNYCPNCGADMREEE